MKSRVDDPLMAARAAGGCTFEPAIGWWTYTNDPAQAASLGSVFEDGRDAIYIPTIQKSGVPVDVSTVESIKRRAAQLGMLHLSCAQGMWVLSETGEAQVETIWIAWSEHCQFGDQLKFLAAYICAACNQDAVALELGGNLEFTGAQPVKEAA